jgi:hypothetical protein
MPVQEEEKKHMLDPFIFLLFFIPGELKKWPWRRTLT